MLYSYVYETPIGMLTITADERHIKSVGFGESLNGSEIETELIKLAGMELREYFEGRRKRFDLALLPQGTEFQKAVWEALESIPYGEVRTYSEIAKAIGKPKAVRAVGQACHKNPIPVFIPCHRVIGKSGKLTGYAGGIGIKEKLLELEKVLPVITNLGSLR